MIYLDNGATTHKKPINTLLSTLKALTVYSANPARASHKVGLKTELKVLECRNTIKQFVNAPVGSNVIYTYNCTEAINFVIKGLIKKSDHVIISTFEHNAVLRTIVAIGCKYTIVKPDKSGLITKTQIELALEPNTKLVIINHTSNVTGKTTNLEPIGKLLNSKKIYFCADCAQSAGHETIDMQKYNLNFVTLAGHKGLFGPQGIGALILNKCDLTPLKHGGSGTDSLDKFMPNYYPEKLEAGTINSVGVLGLDAGIKFVLKKQNKINKHVQKLTAYAYNNLKQHSNIILYSDNPNSGVVTFNIKNIDPNLVVDYLNNKNIYVRGGLHCAPLAHKYLGTEKTGAIRASISFFNKFYEIKKFIKHINKICLNKVSLQ